LTKNKKGKPMVTIPKGAKILKPILVSNIKTDKVVAISNEGRLLIHSLSELPVLAKGKGIKIISIPASRVAEREEFVQHINILPEGEKLTIISGKRHLTLKVSDLENYIHQRGRRGNKLPRGLQKVDKLLIGELYVSKKAEAE